MNASGNLVPEVEPAGQQPVTQIYYPLIGGYFRFYLSYIIEHLTQL